MIECSFELQTESEAVELGEAESGRTNIKMVAGELKVDGGAAVLIEADFAYNVAYWRPEVSYDDVNSGTGTEIVVRLAGGIGDRELRRRFLSANPVRGVLDTD